MRLIARFAQEQLNCFEIITVYDQRTITERINKKTPVLVSISNEYPTASWFERKIHDDFGIEILYNNDNRPLVKHQHFPDDVYPMRKTYHKRSIETYRPLSKIVKIDKRAVVLGPVHPYHLESSQFQLFATNNEISHINVIPFYKHRGIEKMVEGLSIEEAKPIIERISGSMSIAYQCAYMDIWIQASRREAPSIIKKRHAFLLEFERVINHLHDLAILCRFAKFNAGFTFLMQWVEASRSEMKNLTGHRFGFGAVNLNRHPIDTPKSYEFLMALSKKMIWFETWIKNNTSFWYTLIGQGTLTKTQSRDYGLVGIMARSVHNPLDRRMENPLYQAYNFHPALEEYGDVNARFRIRITEIHTSLRLMQLLLETKMFPFFLGKIHDGQYTSYIESSAGELMMYLWLKDGKIERFFVRDPSFLNAQALPLISQNSELNDLGTIIKSIPLSFSTNDL